MLKSAHARRHRLGPFSPLECPFFPHRCTQDPHTAAPRGGLDRQIFVPKHLSASQVALRFRLFYCEVALFANLGPEARACTTHTAGKGHPWSSRSSGLVWDHVVEGAIPTAARRAVQTIARKYCSRAAVPLMRTDCHGGNGPVTAGRHGPASGPTARFATAPGFGVRANVPVEILEKAL